MIEYLLPILSAWFTMIIILDPLLSVSMFINLTQNLTKAEVIKQAFIATAVAGILMLSFLFFDDIVFVLLNIERESFKVAGGVNTKQDALLYYCIISELLEEDWLSPDLFRIGTSKLANALLTEIEKEEIQYF